MCHIKRGMTQNQTQLLPLYIRTGLKCPEQKIMRQKVGTYSLKKEEDITAH